MKNILLVIFLFYFSVRSFSQTIVAPKNVKLSVLYTLQYCGGAKPTKEILEQLNIPKPLVNCELRFVREVKKAFKSYKVKTDNLGEALIDLKKGKYEVYLSCNKKNSAIIPYNKSCKKIYKMLLAVLEFDGLEATLNIKFACNPCLEEIKDRK